MPLTQHEQQVMQDIRASTLRIERDVEELRKVVLQGNGRPALTERVALLEARPAHPPGHSTGWRRTIAEVGVLLGTIIASILSLLAFGRAKE